MTRQTKCLVQHLVKAFGNGHNLICPRGRLHGGEGAYRVSDRFSGLHGRLGIYGSSQLLSCWPFCLDRRVKGHAITRGPRKNP
jgi:hypothetical protein